MAMWYLHQGSLQQEGTGHSIPIPQQCLYHGSLRAVRLLRSVVACVVNYSSVDAGYKN